MIATTLTSRQAARPGAGVTPQSQAILRPAGGLTSVQQSPLRRRIQDGTNHRFFRKKYDAQRVLAQFAITARDETEPSTSLRTGPDALTAELACVVHETLQPEQVSVWLRPSSDRSMRSQP
ncbi:hypothetical protein [Candidatus Amarolinea aalborgensis]|uniref:hypothetical protein n=1 Tax=Candidatus Amarolinea aalborgensis TaxID=2249329 RepID=UPI003BF9E52C